jgi:methionyl-tRNA formyltransferase
VTTADARVDWSAPPVAIDRLVRSVTPEPGAWTTFRGDRLGLSPVTLLAADTEVPVLKPGELHVEKRRVLAGTVGAPVQLGEVRPVGKRAMPAPDWARGVRIDAGEHLT